MHIFRRGTCDLREKWKKKPNNRLVSTNNSSTSEEMSSNIWIEGPAAATLTVQMSWINQNLFRRLKAKRATLKTFINPKFVCAGASQLILWLCPRFVPHFKALGCQKSLCMFIWPCASVLSSSASLWEHLKCDPHPNAHLWSEGPLCVSDTERERESGRAKGQVIRTPLEMVRGL